MKDLLDTMDTISDARHFAEAIRMAHRSPDDDEARAIAAVAFHVTTLLDSALDGLKGVSAAMVGVSK